MALTAHVLAHSAIPFSASTQLLTPAHTHHTRCTHYRITTKSLSVASVAFVCSTYANARLPKMLGTLLDDSSSSSPDPSLRRRSVALFVAGGLGSMVRTALLSSAECKIISKMKKDVYEALLNSDLSKTFSSR